MDVWEPSKPVSYASNSMPGGFTPGGFSVGRGRGFRFQQPSDTPAQQERTVGSSYTVPDSQNSNWQNNNVNSAKANDSGWNDDAPVSNSTNLNSSRGFTSGNQAADDGWDETPSTNNSGWKSSSADTSGWNEDSGSSGWKGDGNSQGWKSEDRSYGSRGGGGGGSGNRACFKCHQEGHMSKDCPSQGPSDRQRKGCFKCGQEGHISRDCPSEGDRPKRGCYKCGEEGHMSKDCPSNTGGARSRGCFKCGQEGHMSRECPSSDAGNEGGRFGGRGLNSEGGNDGEDKSRKGCFRCHEDGHMAKDCTNEPVAKVGPDGKPIEAPYVNPDIQDQLDWKPSSIGENFDRYDNLPVEVSDSRFSRPQTTFAEMGFGDLILSNIRKLNYVRPTPIQKHAVQVIVAGRDLMACAQTGSGKTAAFMLPIIQTLIQDPDIPSAGSNQVQAPLALVLSPTRELAHQIANDTICYANDSVLKTVLMYGGTSSSVQIGRLCRGCHILIATPGRLKDVVNKGKVVFSELRYFVLDEADRMLDLGFEPDVRSFAEHSTMRPKGERQTLMFSATFPDQIQTLAHDFLKNPVKVTVGVEGSANKDVDQEFFQVPHFEKREKLLEVLQNDDERVMVFVEKKKTADFLAAFLSQKGIKTTSIHGDRYQRQREEALADFTYGKCPVIVATAVAARGLDIKDVRHVINYDLPQTCEEYIHRIGRTGRVGNKGKATSFYDSDSNRNIAKDLVKVLNDCDQRVPDWLEQEAQSNGSGGGSWNSGPSRGFGGSGGSSSWNSGGGGAASQQTFGAPPVQEEEW